jgi:hypothetical protein
MTITYEVLLEELRKEVGPLAKTFLDKAMDSLGISDINEGNYRDVIEVLKMNPAIRKYIGNVEKRLESSQ